jgi:hypothetical protein
MNNKPIQNIYKKAQNARYLTLPSQNNFGTFLNSSQYLFNLAEEEKFKKKSSRL